MTGNDVETGTVKTRFDMELGADVVRVENLKLVCLQSRVNYIIIIDVARV